MGTKSTRSSGSQHNPKGVTQGVTLVDPKSGNPIDTVVDSNGTKRLAVDANFTAQNVEAYVELDYTEDSVEIGDSSTGATLNINTDGSIDANVEVDAADGDNIGLKVQQRNLSPDDTKYNKLVTAVTGTGTNANSTSLDVSLHDEDGNSYTTNNPLPTQLGDGVNNITSTTIGSDVGLDVNVIGGVNIEVDVNATDGDNIGLKVQQRNLAPDDTKYNKLVTAVTGTGSDATATSLDVALHDSAGNSYSATNPLYVNSTEILKQLQAPLDFFGNQSVSIRTNQIEVPLDDTNWTSFVDITNVSTGASSQANGQVTLTTGTNANGRYAILSKDFVKYRPGTEIGWGFTWNFPTASTATSYIRIGVTDNITTWDNSVYFGHETGIFSLIYRRSNVTIFSVAPSNWLDKCDGTVGSKYVNFAGTPVALDITKDQLARIRAGLFGHAGFVVELLAPNQTWVKIYEYGNINTANVPVFANFDLKIGAEVKKVSGNSNVYTLSSACWAGWTGSVLTRMDAPLSDRTLAQVTRTIIEGKSSSGGGTYIPVKVNPSGSLEVSLGDIGGVAGQDTMANSLPVVIASDQSSIPVDLNAFSSTPDSVMIVGSQDGTQAGLKFGMVYNRRKQILDSHDRVASFTYADFGTKNQRITQIDYSSPTFPGSIVRRQFSYSLVGNNYKRDNETWTIF